jgi:simple sugar transport system permease protein
MPETTIISSRLAGFWRKLLDGLVRYTLTILLALGLFGVILLISGRNPLHSYRDMLVHTMGSAYGFSEVLVAMTPMLLTALAVALPSRLILINVGVEGQLYMGACFATWAALTFPHLPAYVLLPLMAFVGMLGGALWAFIPGYLKARGIVNETITTLLLNSVAPKIVSFFIFGFWHSPMDTDKTANFVPAARLPTFFGTRIDLSLFIGLALLVVFWWFVKYTRWGLEMRAIGGNPQAARRNGIPVSTYLVVGMCVGGAIAGLAGMAQVSGYYGLLLANFSRGIGYMGFLISWLSFGDPLGILLMSFVVAVIFTGGNLLQLTQGLPFAAINLLLALTLFVVLARPQFSGFIRRKTA